MAAKRKASRKKKPIRAAGRFWVWLYYKPSQGEQMEAALLPWKQWGSSSGSGSDGYESDISWDHDTLAQAKSAATRMHARLQKAKVSHMVQIIDTGEYDYAKDKLLTLGRWRGRRRR